MWSTIANLLASLPAIYLLILAIVALAFVAIIFIVRRPTNVTCPGEIVVDLNNILVLLNSIKADIIIENKDIMLLEEQLSKRTPLLDKIERTVDTINRIADKIITNQGAIMELLESTTVVVGDVTTSLARLSELGMVERADLKDLIKAGNATAINIDKEISKTAAFLAAILQSLIKV